MKQHRELASDISGDMNSVGLHEGESNFNTTMYLLQIPIDLQLFADETQLVDKVSCETSLTLHLGPV
jgi:hypothetical protein